MTEPLLAIENLITEYTTDHGVVRAVNGLDLCVETGQVVGVIGESGCGKTTMVLSILRLLGNGGRIVSGSINFDGRDLLTLSQAEMRRVRGGQIAAVFQDVTGQQFYVPLAQLRQAGWRRIEAPVYAETAHRHGANDGRFSPPVSFLGMRLVQHGKTTGELVISDLVVTTLAPAGQ